MNNLLNDYHRRDPVSRYRARGSGARLVAITAVIRGRVIALRQEFVVGSSPRSDYIITGASMAPKHVSLSQNGELWSIATVDPRARLWVNGEPVRVAVLGDEDRVTIGKHTFLFFET
ncbi:MAG: FHA domain-containing protein [Pseudomonadales bacterium]|nr:FHA domain-containing protein [Pseudomonadales bacterium]